MNKDKEKNLAEKLHQLFCRSNHEDQCGWEYEKHHQDIWGGYSHKYWLEKAREVEKVIDELL